MGALLYDDGLDMGDVIGSEGLLKMTYDESPEPIRKRIDTIREINKSNKAFWGINKLEEPKGE